MARTAVTASCVWHAVLAAVVVFAASSTTRAAAHAAPASHAHAALASGWKDLGRVADDEPVPVVLALRHGISDAALESHCTDIADPASDRYGHHLSRAALAQLLRSDAHREAVEAWLRDAGVRDWQVGGVGDSVAFVAPAATVNAMLGARMHILETPGGILVTRSVSGHAVPNRVAGAVELVLGVSDFVVGEAGGPGSPASSLAARMRCVAVACVGCGAAFSLWCERWSCSQRLKQLALRPRPPPSVARGTGRAILQPCSGRRSAAPRRQRLPTRCGTSRRDPLAADAHPICGDHHYGVCSLLSLRAWLRLRPHHELRRCRPGDGHGGSGRRGRLSHRLLVRAHMRCGQAVALALIAP